MKNQQLVIGTRGSRLALSQAAIVREKLGEKFPDLKPEIKIIKTEADLKAETPISLLVNKNAFVKALEDALFSGEIDLAVHSLKDLPALLPQGLKLGAYLTHQGSPSDALVSRQEKKLAGLPPHAVIASSSPRRRLQLKLLREDLEFIEIRGNVDTRLKKLESGAFNALILAQAGLNRLGLSQHITEVFPPRVIIPAAGQGVMAAETRDSEAEILALLAAIDDSAQHYLSELERSFLAYLEVDCQSPAGVWAEYTRQGVEVHFFLADSCGENYLKETRPLPKKPAIILGRELGESVKPQWEKMRKI